MKRPTLRSQLASSAVTRQRGMAVVGALVVASAVALFSVTVLEQQTSLAESLATDRDRRQAEWLVRGGLDWARVVLLNDARRSGATRAGAVWSQPVTGLPVTLPGSSRQAVFSGQITDEQGKFNLARLTTPAGTLDEAALARLDRLLHGLGLPSASARLLAERLRDAVAAGVVPLAVDDLLPLPGVSFHQEELLSGHLTLLPAEAPLNINTAGAHVLAATLPGLSAAQAREIVDRRADGEAFSSVGDFIRWAGISQPGLVSRLSVDSQWFLVSGTVTLEHAGRGLKALLQRPGATLPIVRWIKD